MPDVAMDADQTEQAASPASARKKLQKQRSSFASLDSDGKPRTRAQKGRLRCADNTELVFYDGLQALQEVAKPDGGWNWALVGPDPVNMPLSAGGFGLVEDMQDALGNFPILFGLIRFSFKYAVHYGDGKASVVKHVFIQASNSDDEDGGKFNARQRGQAIAVEGKMVEVMKGLANFAVKVEVTSKELCNTINMILGLQKAASGADAKIISVDNYNEGRQLVTIKLRGGMHDASLSEALALLISQEEERRRTGEDFVNPLASVAEPAHEPVLDRDPSRQRKSVKQMKVGDQVELFSPFLNKWFLDGEVMEAVTETTTIDRTQVGAGSVKVVYNNFKQFRWLAPAQFAGQLRPSLRPSPPQRISFHLGKETHGWFTEWHKRFFVLDHGCILWWVSEEEKDSAKPQKVFSLLGLHMQDPARGDKKFKFMTTATKGVLYSFEGETPDDTLWIVDAIYEHSEYREEIAEWDDAKHETPEAKEALAASQQERRQTRRSTRGPSNTSLQTFLTDAAGEAE